MATTKRKKGDRWGLSCTDTNTSVTKPVQIGGWESSTFVWRSQAEKYAQSYNDRAKEHNHPKFFQVVYAGNTHEGVDVAGYLI